MPKWAKGCLAGCGVLLVLVIVLGIWGANTAGKAMFGPPPPAPALGKAAALRPTFVLRKGEPYQAGTAAAVSLRPGSPPMLITALHLLGSAGGYEREVAPKEIDSVVREVRLTTIAGSKPVAVARGALRKSGPVLTEDNEILSRDLAAWRIASGKVDVLPLAAKNPAPFEWVWVVGDEVNHEPQTQRLFPGRVTFAADDGGVMTLQKTVTLQAFSGAPIVNAKGEVVGLLIGGSENGKVGMFNPAGGIRKTLEADGIR